MNNKTTEFNDKRILEFKTRIEQESKKLIADIIDEKSPLKIGEEVSGISSSSFDECKFKISRIELKSMSNYGFPTSCFSFAYFGKRIGKNGKPMKNRNEETLLSFKKEGQKFSVPSYNRVDIVSAKCWK